jgi:hypothetical protein
LRFERENSGGTRGALQIPPLRFASVGMTILLGQSMTPERFVGMRPSFSAHVRSGERGTPVDSL